MNIIDIFENQKQDGYTTKSDDNSIPKLSDLRKTKLTLKQINRLRIMNDVRTLEHEQKLKSVQNQYKTTVPSDVSI